MTRIPTQDHFFFDSGEAMASRDIWRWSGTWIMLGGGLQGFNHFVQLRIPFSILEYGKVTGEPVIIIFPSLLAAASVTST